MLYETRKDKIRINVESYERRLTNEYIGLAVYLCNNVEVDKRVFYLVAYHILSIGKHYGFRLTEMEGCPFPIYYKENLTPLAKSRLEKFNDKNSFLYKDVASYFGEQDALFFNNILHEFSDHYHLTKHFSLILDLIDNKALINSMNFFKVCEMYLDTFILNYKILLLTKYICMYTPKSELDEIKNDIKRWKKY